MGPDRWMGPARRLGSLLPRPRSAPDRPLSAEISGAGEPAVLLLHGQPGTGADWQWVVPHLAGRYTVIVPDRPGYGRTGGPATGFAGNARAGVALLDELEVERAVWVAHSWAGAVALAAAETTPERVAGLVMVSSVGPGTPVAWDDRMLAAPVVGDVVAAATVAGIELVLGRRRVRDLAERRLVGRPHDAVVALTRLTGGPAEGGHEPVWRSFVAEQRALVDELEALGPGLADIRIPTVVVHGSSDHMVPPAAAERLHAAIPGASLRLIPGAGHLLPHDRPRAVAEAVHRVVSQAAG